MYLKQSFLSTTKFVGCQKVLCWISPEFHQYDCGPGITAKERKKKTWKDVIHAASVQRYRFADDQQAMNR